MKKILLTGGTGFIGSHIAVELLENSYEVYIIDNLSNSKKEVVNKIELITGKAPKFENIDIKDFNALNEYFSRTKFDAVVHLAGLKAVGESVSKPLAYYENNVSGTVNLLKCMLKYNVMNLIFSSSACVYGDCKNLPISEEENVSVINPYGRTKYFIEEIICDVVRANPKFNATILRYFNPIGAHKSGLIGEDPNDIPNNIMPYILKVASGEYEHLNIFGNDYNTIDGTGIRDYIHVLDLANAHMCAIEHILKVGGLNIYNIGTGKGTSVLELVNAFSEQNGVKLNYKFTSRREGDSEAIYTNPSKAQKELNWRAKYDINEMCKDAYNFIVKNKK